MNGTRNEALVFACFRALAILLFSYSIGNAHAVTERWCGSVSEHWLPSKGTNCGFQAESIADDMITYANSVFAKGPTISDNDVDIWNSAVKEGCVESLQPIATPTLRCEFTMTTTILNKATKERSTSQQKGAITSKLQCGPRMNTTWLDDRQQCVQLAELEKPQCQVCRVGEGALSPLDGLPSATVPILDVGGTLSMSLSYSPARAAQGSAFGQLQTPSLGNSWFSSLHRSYIGMHVVDGGFGYVFLRGDGSTRTFSNSGSTPASLGDIDPAPLKVNGNLIYRDVAAGALEEYQRAASGIDMEGFDVKKISFIDGRTLTYSPSIQSIRQFPARAIFGVQDESGRALGFVYEHDASDEKAVAFGLRLAKVVGPDGGEFSFVSAGSTLNQISFPDGTTRRFTYGVNGLTSEIDEEGAIYKTYGYDAQGRANEVRIGSQLTWSLSWDTPPTPLSPMAYDEGRLLAIRRQRFDAPVRAQIHRPDGSIETREGVSVDGSMVTLQSARSAGPGTAQSTVRTERDAFGNVVRRVDENGVQSCFMYDAARHVETARVEGLSEGTNCATALSATSDLPAGARRITTAWHPDWRKTTQIATPLRRETLVYNGQPDPFAGGSIASCAPVTAILPSNKPIVVLCKRIEQATTDATGGLGLTAPLNAAVPPRVSSWTYNATGRVLTETDARGVVVMTNEYYDDTTTDHFRGDLKSSKNAQGHVVSFPRYNAYGKPLEIVDANGSSTTFTYDLRQRLKSVTTLDATTSYLYRLNGLLDRVVEPGGAQTSYEYDDARRLKAVSDSRGNRIEYALDASGNRIGETTKDPNGTLQRTMSRAFDALNRAQQTTGRE